MTKENPKITKSMIIAGCCDDVLKIMDRFREKYGGEMPLEAVINAYGKEDLILI